MTPLRLALAAALLLPTAPIPQQPAGPTLKVDTKLTVVDVTVTDKYGKPVHGLKPEDFVIKEDGKPQPIKNFDEYGTAPPTISMGPKLPPGIYTNQTAPAPTGAVNILLLSQLERSNDMIYARAQAESYLKTMPTGARTSLMLLQNGGVNLLQNLTTDREVLAAHVSQIKYQVVPDADFSSSSSFFQSCSIANRQSHLTLEALNQIAASVASLKGRKNLIWFTHGIPWLTNVSYFRGYLKIDCLEELTDQLHQTYANLAAAQVAIYTIDPRGLYGVPGNTDFINRQISQESIRNFAEATGGQAFYNRNDLDAAMGEAVASGSVYYSIAYTPPQQGYDGKYHSIDVKLARAGLHLQYRKGYTSLDLAKLNSAIDAGKDSAVNRAKAAADPLAALSPAVSLFRSQMAHGALPSTELLLAARIIPAATPSKPAPPSVKGDLNPKVKPSPLIRYDVIYALPAGQVTLSENPDGSRKGAVEFDIVAYAEDGTKLNVLRQTASINLKPDQAADFNKNPFEVPLQLDLPPGKLFVRVGALDTLSGKSGTLEVSQTVAKPQTAAKSQTVAKPATH